MTARKVKTECGPGGPKTNTKTRGGGKTGETERIVSSESKGLSEEGGGGWTTRKEFAILQGGVETSTLRGRT